MPEQQTDVVIVGAGPTGLMAALLLVRSGVAVRILDKSPTAAKESRALAIQARTLELLLSLGLADRFIDRGVLASGAALYVDGRRAAAFAFDDLGRSDTPYPTILMLPQSDTEALLLEELSRAGVAVERDTEVTGLDQSPDGVTIQATADGRPVSITAAYVLGADGAHSLVRKALGLRFEGSAYPQTFLLADCKVDWSLANGPFSIFMHGPDFALFLPLKGQDHGRIITLDSTSEPDPTIAGQGSSPVTLPEVEEAFRRATQIELTLSDPRWTSRYRVHHRGVNAYGAGRVFVAGDAAHIHSPAGGQGMNTGLQDVANLCWKLVAVLRHGAPAALLATYDAERRPVGQKVLAYTDRAFSFMTSQKGWMTGLRDTLVPIFGATAAKSSAVRARAFGFVSELGIRYDANAALAEDDRPAGSTGGPAPGHRAPDAAIARKTNVFDLIGGYAFHLLAFSRVPLTEADVVRLRAELDAFGDATGVKTHLVAHSFIGRDPRLVQAETGAVFTAYGVGDDGQALYLIRPDGYVAGRWNGLDLAPCRAAMARFGAPTT